MSFQLEMRTLRVRAMENELVENFMRACSIESIWINTFTSTDPSLALELCHTVPHMWRYRLEWSAGMPLVCPPKSEWSHGVRIGHCQDQRGHDLPRGYCADGMPSQYIQSQFLLFFICQFGLPGSLINPGVFLKMFIIFHSLRWYKYPTNWQQSTVF